MKKAIITTIAILVSSGMVWAQETWIIDPVHSSIQFEVSHMTVSSVTGNFTSFSGFVETTAPENFDKAEVNLTISVPSITTNNMERDAHLKEDDFFNASRYPNITFKSTSFSMEDDGDFEITGDLTIRDVTQVITLSGKHGGVVSLNNQKKAGFQATTAIDRFKYGLKWDDVLDSGGLVVGEEVTININVELIRQ